MSQVATAVGPVVGIAEAAMRVAVLLGRSFSVVTSLPRTVGHAAWRADTGSLVALGLRTSKRDEYATPPVKPVTGPLSTFTLRRE